MKNFNYCVKALKRVQKIFLGICMLAALSSSYFANAQQNTLISVSPGVTLDCQQRISVNSQPWTSTNFAYLGNFRYEIHIIEHTNDPAILNSFEIEILGNFSAADLNNANGGALIYKSSSFDPQNPRGSILGAVNINGPGTYTIIPPANRQDDRLGEYHFALELSENASPNDLWLRSTINQSNFNFTPARSFSGSISGISGLTDPKPTLPSNIQFHEQAGTIGITWNTSEVEELEFITDKTNTLNTSHFVDGDEGSISLTGLLPGREVDIDLIARNKMPGCNIETLPADNGRFGLLEFNVRVCPNRPAPPVSIQLDDVSSVYVTLTVAGNSINNVLPGTDRVRYKTVLVMREAGTPRVGPTDGMKLRSFRSHLNPGEPSARYFGDFDIGGGNYNVTSTSFLEPNTTYVIDAYVMGTVIRSNSTTATECAIYSSFISTTFSTCPDFPSRATDNTSSAITETSATLSWVNGDGDGRITVIRDAAVDGIPNSNAIEGLEFQGNTNFASAPLFPGSQNTRIVHSGQANTIQVTDLLSAHNYVYYVFEYNGDGACRRYSFQTAQNIHAFQTLSNDLSVSTQTVTNRTSSSAVVGGNVELINNVSVSERGVVWSTASNPDLNDNRVIAGAGSGAFTASIQGMNPERRHFVRAYAIANGQTFFGNERQFFSTSIEPSGDPTNFELVSLQTISANNLSATFDWDGASGASGYLLLYRTDGSIPTTAGIEDGVNPEDLDLTSGTFLASDQIIESTGYVQNNGVFPDLEYNYLLLPVAANQDNNPQTYNYKTSGSLATLSFVTDIDAPMIISFQPLNGAQEVPAGGVLSIQWNEEITKGKGDIEILDAVTLNAIRTIPINSANVTINGQVLTIDPEGLPFLTEMYPVIPAGAFVDGNGNASEAFSGKSVWQFTTAEQGDVTAPVLTRLTPENGSSNVSVSSSLRIDFDEPVTAGTGNLTIKRQSGNSNVQVIPLNGPGVEVFQNRVIVSPDMLPGETDLYITVDNGAITDLSGNAFEGITNPAQWTFTTGEGPDIDSPSIISLSPADNQVDVLLNEPLTVRFDEPTLKGAGFIALKFATDGTTRETINVNSAAVSISGTIATITPADDLPGSTELYVEISPGAFKDQAGNLFDGISDPTAWSFTTTAPPDGTQPQLLANSLNPVSGTVNVPFSTNLEFSFNENVLKGTGDILITRTFDEEVIMTIDVTSNQVNITNSMVTIIPSTDLGEGTFSVTIPATAFKDDADNFYAGLLNDTWTFTTTAIPPVITALDPVNGATDVSINTTLLTMTFDEEVTAGTSGFFIIRNLLNNAPIVSIQPEEPQVSYNGQEVSVEVNLSPALYGTGLYVQVTNGFVQDLNGNPLVGFSNNTTWNFTLEDQPDVTVPTLMTNAFSPTDNAINVTFDTDLSFQFNEPVVLNGGIMRIRDFNTDAIVETIALATNAVVNGNEVTIARSNNLGEGQFYIEIDEETFADAFGNEFEGLFDKNTWNFTTIGIPPSVVNLAPATGAIDVPVVFTASATFDEPIALGNSGSIFIRRLDNNAVIRTIDRTSPAVTIDGVTLSVDFDLTGFESTEVYLRVQTGSITDLNGNVLSALNINTWNFTTAVAPDITGPVLVGGTNKFSPIDGAFNVAPDANLTMTFNEDIEKGSGTITFHRSSDDALLQGILANDPAVTINGSVVTIDPPTDLADVGMYVLVSPDAFQDQSGNFFAGIDNKNTWNFTPEIVRPMLVSVDPAFGSIDFPVGEPVTITATFSEDIVLGSGGSISLRRRDNNATLQSIQLDDPGIQVIGDQFSFEVMISENEAFSELEFYVLVSIQAIEDLNGNISTGIINNTDPYTTEKVDLTPPFVFTNSFFPEDDAFDVPYNTDLSFEFTEPVVKKTGNILIRDALNSNEIVQTIDINSPQVTISGTTIIIDPVENLPESTLYVEIEQNTFEDLFGNPFTQVINGFQFWKFTTFEVPLEIIDFSPAHSSTNIQINEPVPFEITFSHDIALNPQNPGDILIRFNQGNGVRYTIAADDPDVTLTGNKLRWEQTFDPGLNGFEFYVQVQTGVVKDLEGRSINQQIAKGGWHITTEEVSPPAVLSLSPTDDATNVPTDANLVITFNEDIALNSQFYALLGSLSNNNIEEFQDDSPRISVSGNQITIDPTDDFVEGQTYRVTLGSNSVVDVEGSGNERIQGNLGEWDFSVGDAEAPEIVTLTPADNTGEVALDTDFIMAFTEPVFADIPGNLLIRRSDNTLFESIPIPDSRLTGLGTNTLTFNLNNTLQTNQAYYVTLGNGVLEDATGNSFQGITNSTAWNFTTSTADIVNPTLVSLSPADNEPEAGINTNLVIQLNENIQWGTGSVLLKEFDTDNVVGTFNSTSGNNIISLNTLRIILPGDLTPLTSYYVEVEATALQDLNDNPYAGFTGKTTWNFTTLSTDNTSPAIVSFSPADNDTEVPEDVGELVITYDEPIQGISGAYDLRRIGGSSSTKVFTVGTVDVNISGNTVTLLNVPTLSPHQDYYIRNVAIVEDLAGNSAETWNTSETRWNFSTFSDLTAPTLVSRFPTDDAVEVDASTNLVLELNEPIGGNFLVTIRDYDSDNHVASFSATSPRTTIDGNVVTFDPNDLDRFTQYYVTVQNMTDAATNSFPDILDKEEWNFIVDVIDNDPPTITSLTPANGSTDVPLETSEFTVVFSEPVFPRPGASAIRLRRTLGNGIVQEFAFGSEDMMIDGNTITLQNVNKLSPGTDLYLQGGNALQDEAENIQEDWPNNNSTWSFTTEELPDDVAFLPADNAQDVSPNTDLQIGFNKPVVKGSGFIKIFRDEDDSEIVSINVNSSNVVIDDNLVTITLPGGLPDFNIGVYVLMDDGIFTDENGNLYTDGTPFTSSWNFTLQSTDQTPPAIVSLTPADNAQDVDPNSDLVIEFDEPVFLEDRFIRVHFYATNGTQQSVTLFSSNVSVNGNTVTVNLPNPMPVTSTATRLWVEIPTFAIRDEVGNFVEAIEIPNRDDWDFTVVPRLTHNAVFPADGSIDVSPDTELRLEFPRNVVKGTGEIHLINDDTNIELLTIDVNSPEVTIADGIVLINPLNGLPNASLNVRALVDAGSFEDVFGNEYLGLNSILLWNFSILSDDTTPPQILTVSPADDATDVAASSDLVITFSEPVFLGNSSFLVKNYNAGTNRFVISYASDNVTVNENIITIDLPDNLDFNSHYWIQINPGTITDFAGNGADGIVAANRDDWDFFTEVATPPNVVNLLPENGATEVALNQNLIVTFDEDIMEAVNGTTKILIIKNRPGSTNFEVIDVTGDKVTITGNQFVVEHEPFAPGQEYSIVLLDGILADLSNTFFEGFALDEWTFTTGTKQDQTITFDELSTKTFGDASFDLPATASSMLAVSYTSSDPSVATIEGNTVSIVGAGISVITASQVGSDDFNPAIDVIQNLIVDKAGQVIVLNIIDDKITTDDPFMASASVDSGLPLTWTVSGPATILGTTVTLDGTAGTVTITASQSGDDNYNEISASISFMVTEPIVVKMNQTITFEALSNRTFGDEDFELLATASSNLDVTFSVVNGPISINGSALSIRGAGTATVAANQSGNEDYHEADEIIRSFEISKADQIITLMSIENKFTNDAPFEVEASVDSGLELDYSVEGPASISGSTITLTGSEGIVTVTVDQSGNTNYNLASATASFEVVAEVEVLAAENFVSGIKIYPNPTSDWLNIDSPYPSISSIQLFDIRGGLLIVQQLDEQTRISLQDLENGLYLLKLTNNEITTTTKVLIRR